MRIFHGIAGLLALVFVVAVLVRHGYVRWLEPRTSVMDEFRTKTETDIAESKTLAELTAMYRENHPKVLEADRKLEEEWKKAKSDAQRTGDAPSTTSAPESRAAPSFAPEPPTSLGTVYAPPAYATPSGYAVYDQNKTNREPWKRDQELQRAITVWEEHADKIYELHCFWWAGFVCCVIGALCWRGGWCWLGTAFAVTGWLEMMWWTSPVFGGRSEEFEQLLTWKVIYDAGALMLLLLAWTVVARRPAMYRTYWCGRR
ncbi:MAG: hypothetical protein QM811_23930 [Pirellulales bacterium]